MWSNKMLACAIIVQWILPVAIVSPYFWVGIVHSPIGNSTSIAIKFENIFVHRFYYVVGTVYMGVVSCLLSIIRKIKYVCTCGHFKDLKRLEWLATLRTVCTR